MVEPPSRSTRTSTSTKEIRFDHEKLDVYQISIRFIEWRVFEVKYRSSIQAIYNQLERASISIPLNIAEGNGKSSFKDRKRFFEVSRGSAFECAACLDILFSMKVLNQDQLSSGKQLLHRIVSMLSRMISNLANSVQEGEPPYESDVPDG